MKWTEIVPEAVPVRWETGERGEPEAAALESGEPQAAVPESGGPQVAVPESGGPQAQTRSGAPEADRLLNGADGTPFLTYGRLVRVLEGPGLAGDTGWRSWLEEAPALTEGCYLGVGFPEDDSRDGARGGGRTAISRDSVVECGRTAISRDSVVECGRTAISRSSAAECDRDGARQILCACGAVKLTVMLRGRPESVYTVRLSRGDYALLEENVCYKVLREPGTPGYYYILSPKGLM